MEGIPFIVTGGEAVSSPPRKKGERRGRHGPKHLRNKEIDTGMARSNQESGESNVNSFCSVCQTKNQGMMMMCLRCGHGGHLRHIREWFSDDVHNWKRKCAIATCTCHCVFKEEEADSVQWTVC